MNVTSRQIVAAFRKYTEEELESTIRQMRIEGGTLEDIEAELNTLADSALMDYAPA